MNDVNKLHPALAANRMIAIEGDGVPLPPPPMKKPRTVAAVGGPDKLNLTPDEYTQSDRLPGNSRGRFTNGGTDKSAATEAQRRRIIESLRVSPKTSHDLRCEGIYNPPARVSELRGLGYIIRTETVTLYDRDGYAHPRAARYHLDGEAGGAL